MAQIKSTPPMRELPSIKPTPTSTPTTATATSISTTANSTTIAANTAPTTALELSEAGLENSHSVDDMAEFFRGFSKLNRDERVARLLEMGALSPEDIDYLASGGVQNLDLAENLIENAIGYLQVPFGVATNFRIDQRDYLIPMAVEETSIIAAASKTARWIREEGGRIVSQSLGDCILGQVQVPRVKNLEAFQAILYKNKNNLIQTVNTDVAGGLVARGGGVRDFEVRSIPRPDGDTMAVVQIRMDACDAMGANIMNQVCEYLKNPIESLTGEKVGMCILSNLADTKITRCEIIIPNVDPELGEAIAEASLFAEIDPYRAATHNKGVLNGIDAVLLATGNDWRAVEAGVHAYAARDGSYRGITKWTYSSSPQRELRGVFEAPIVVGTVGGVTKLHPTAHLALRMLKVNSAAHLARICAAVGLVQNLGALKALTTVGIIEGHMKLHIRNLTLGAGALEKEAPLVQKRLEEILRLRKRISMHNAVEVLEELRASQSSSASASASASSSTSSSSSSSSAAHGASL